MGEGRGKGEQRGWAPSRDRAAGMEGRCNAGARARIVWRAACCAAPHAHTLRFLTLLQVPLQQSPPAEQTLPAALQATQAGGPEYPALQVVHWPAEEQVALQGEEHQAETGHRSGAGIEQCTRCAWQRVQWQLCQTVRFIACRPLACTQQSPPRHHHPTPPPHTRSPVEGARFAGVGCAAVLASRAAGGSARRGGARGCASPSGLASGALSGAGAGLTAPGVGGDGWAGATSVSAHRLLPEALHPVQPLLVPNSLRCCWRPHRSPQLTSFRYSQRRRCRCSTGWRRIAAGREGKRGRGRRGTPQDIRRQRGCWPCV